MAGAVIHSSMIGRRAFLAGASAATWTIGSLARPAASDPIVSTTSGGDNTQFGTQFSNDGEYFRGNLDNIRIWDGALDARQIAGLDAS